MIDLEINNKTNYQPPKKEEIMAAILDVVNAKKIVGDFMVTIMIVSKAEIQKFNKKYRQLDAPTDVLSFPIFNKVPPKSDEAILLGDIVICPEIMSPENSFLDLIKHSTLHLLGYHHKE